MIYSWEAKHTYIEGRQLHFDGHAGELFGRWILWFLGSIGILTLFGMLELGIIWWSNGVIFHPEHYYLFPTPYLAFFVVYLLLIISLILYGTWVEVSLRKWKVSHTRFA
jgi:predicted membrane protein